MPDLRGTNLDPRLTQSSSQNTRWMAQEHQRLFGPGAKISGIDYFMSKGPLDRAMDLRPKSSSAGQDIDLPALSNVAAYATPKKKKKKKTPATPDDPSPDETP